MPETRQDFHARIEKACIENEATSDILQRHNGQATGHPWKEVDQPELFSTNYKHCTGFHQLLTTEEGQKHCPA